MEDCAVLVENGQIADVFSNKRFEQRRFDNTLLIDVNGAIIAPGFIDTHIHGFGGFGTEDALNEEGSSKDGSAILEMSRLLVQQGVTAFNPTIYPSEPASMLKTLKKLSSVMGNEDGAQIMGLHLEGPFISPKRPGIMRTEVLQGVDISLMEKLWEASDGKIVNMTVAPELKGMRELALCCLKKGIVLQAGHTDANYENVLEGIQAGILHSTHLFNAMSPMEHRNPNAVGAILIHREMSCEIIADGFHIHRDLYRLLLRNKFIEKIVLVTDALKPTEQVKSPFYADGYEVIFSDGVFRRKEDNVIAGSSLSMIRGVKNLVDSGFSMEEAIKTSSFNPAKIMGYNKKGAIIPGYDADLVVFSKDFKVLVVISRGEIKKNLFD